MAKNQDDYRPVQKHYRILETLGTGGFGKVKRAVHILTGQTVAVKIMDKKSLGKDLPRAYTEIRTMKELHHQFIIRLYQVIETDSKLFLIIEYCPGGELFDYIVDRGKLSEVEGRKYFRQLVSALGYLHSKGFCHRDLKPENVLLTEGGRHLKLIDFGLCAVTRNADSSLKFLTSACGSPAYKRFKKYNF